MKTISLDIVNVESTENELYYNMIARITMDRLTVVMPTYTIGMFMQRDDVVGEIEEFLYIIEQGMKNDTEWTTRLNDTLIMDSNTYMSDTVANVTVYDMGGGIIQAELTQEELDNFTDQLKQLMK